MCSRHLWCWWSRWQPLVLCASLTWQWWPQEDCRPPETNEKQQVQMMGFYSIFSCSLFRFLASLLRTENKVDQRAAVLLNIKVLKCLRTLKQQIQSSFNVFSGSPLSAWKQVYAETARRALIWAAHCGLNLKKHTEHFIYFKPNLFCGFTCITPATGACCSFCHFFLACLLV